MEEMVLKYYSEEYELRKGNPDAAGFDLPFFDPDMETVTLAPGETKMLKSGIYVATPHDCYAMLDTRSSSAKKGLDLLCRTIDRDYRGNIRMMLHNTSKEPVTIEAGQYVAQLIVLPVIYLDAVRVNSVEELGTTERGDKGFGSTGGNFK